MSIYGDSFQAAAHESQFLNITLSPQRNLFPQPSPDLILVQSETRLLLQFMYLRALVVLQNDYFRSLAFSAPLQAGAPHAFGRATVPNPLPLSDHPADH